MRLLFVLALMIACFAAPAQAQVPGSEVGVPSAAPSAVVTEAPPLDFAPGAQNPGPGTQNAEPMEIGRAPADIPILPYLIQLLVVTGVVAGLAFLSVKFLKDKMPGMGLGLASGKQIKVVDKVVVDPRRMVFVVNVGNRYWLLAATESQVTPVAELTKQDLGGDFAQLLEQEKVRGEML